MPRRNRVTPFGDIIPTEARGLLFENRGVLHDDRGHLVRAWQVRRWHDVTAVRPWPHGPFHYLSSLKPGMYVRYNGKRMRIIVSKPVLQSRVGGFVARYRYNDLALTTCWPRYSATYRWVVIAR